MRHRLIETVRRAKRFRQRARIMGRPHAICLMYHRISTPAADPWGLSVSPRHFDEHLTVLRQIASCRRFGDMVPAVHAPDRPRRLAAITFDDGYRDNLLAAAPLLAAHDMQATVFVTTGMTGVKREFWWDALTRAFLCTAVLPDMLELETATGPRQWHLGSASTCTPAELRLLTGARMPFDIGLHPRIRLMNDVRDALFHPSQKDTDQLAEKVLSWAGLDQGGAPDDHPMTVAEIRQLATSGLIEIGAHTVTHRPLDLLAEEDAGRELAGSRAALRDWLDRDIRSFAYPFGRFGPETPRLVADAGFSAACTTWEHVAVGTKIDPFRFPRIMVRDCDGDGFARMMRQFVGP